MSSVCSGMVDDSDENNVAKLIENSVLLLTFIGACLKMKTIVGSRGALLHAFESLLNTEIYRIQCEETKKLDIEVATVIRSALMNIPARILPFNGWFPFKHADTFGFYIVFTYQIIAVIYFATIGSFTDTIICGGMIHCSNHLKILRYDFENIPTYIKRHSTDS
ncbi:hypothetical protein PV325_000653, partial [Microctonus aethiopoides]